MGTLNYLCRNDISDEDCYKCIKHGIKYSCDNTCPDFDDVRGYMSKADLEERKRLMDKLRITDPFPYEGD